MERVYFRHGANEESVDISFRYANTEHKIDRVFNFRRSCGELVGAFTERTRTNIEKEFNKRNKKKQKTKASEAGEAGTQPPAPEVSSLIPLKSPGKTDRFLPI